MNEAFPFFGDALGPDAKRELEGATTSHLLLRGQALYQAEDFPTGLHLIRRGLVGLVALGPTGKEYLIRLAGPGQFVGHRSLFAEEPHHATALALEDTEILTVSKPAVLGLIEQFPKIALLLLESLAKELKWAELGRVSLADKDVSARIAESVLYLFERFPEHRWTRREIGEFCGSTTATVIRTLARFEAEGIVRQEGRKVVIVKRERLLELAALD